MHIMKTIKKNKEKPKDQDKYNKVVELGGEISPLSVSLVLLFIMSLSWFLVNVHASLGQEFLEFVVVLLSPQIKGHSFKRVYTGGAILEGINELTYDLLASQDAPLHLLRKPRTTRHCSLGKTPPFNAAMNVRDASRLSLSGS